MRTSPIIRYLHKQLGKKNTLILLTALADSCEYTFGKRGLKQVRQINITYNNFFSTKIDLTKGYRISHD